MNSNPNNNNEIIRRLEKLEYADEKMRDAVQELIISNNSMSQMLLRLSELAPRVHQLELQNVSTQSTLKAVRWLAAAVGSVGIAMIMAMLFTG